MAPLITLLAVTLLLRTAGAAGIRPLRSWHTSLRGGLAAMFTLTGTAHFNGMRGDLVAMVPPALPYPELLVTVTGVLELLGAAGLLYRRTAPWAAGGLALLLVAMFPANVHAALAGLMLNGAPATALLPRTLMQLVFIAATVAVTLPYVRALPRHRSAAPRAAGPARIPESLPE
ncbi:MAG TPA: DoxX family membrane protein [Arthrobacter sp.]|nr:DoxX family membrane protein [Arthrobacter sp.]